MTGSTRFVPTDEYYERPPSSASRIAAIVARQPRVDGNGRIVATPAETGTTDVTATVGKSLSMASALIEAAQACGADPQALVDSDSFCLSIGAISPNDGAALREAIADAVAGNPSLALATVTAPGMKSNRAQGSSGGTAPSHPQSTLDRIHDQAAKQMAQPLPPGSTTV